jgi:CelD/BcsL family acetyltransferase involved in cellulose biosynthesis
VSAGNGIAVGDYVVQSLRGGPEQIDRLHDEWEALSSGAAENCIFYRPAWIRAFAAHRPEAAGGLLLLAARREGRLAAVLPLARRRVVFSGLPVRQLHGATTNSWWRFDVVRAPGEAGLGGVRALAGFLGRMGGWDTLVIPDVPPGGAAEDLVREAAALGHPVGRVEVTSSPYLPIQGYDGDPEWWLRGVSGNFRSSMRRALKRTRGSLRLDRIDRADPEALRRLVELEAKGWKGREGSAIASHPEWVLYFRTLVGAAERMGGLVYHFLEHEGRLIAAQFGVASGSRYSMLRIAYDEEFRQLAPGHLLTHAALEDCAARGFSEYDFTGRDEEWKCKWTSHRRVHAHHYVFPRGLYGHAVQLAKFRVSPGLRRLLRRPEAAAVPVPQEA